MKSTPSTSATSHTPPRLASRMLSRRPIKRSSQVSLVLLGSVALFACEQTDTFEYANKQDCVKDWGETECEQKGERRAGGYFFYASAARYGINQARHAKSVKRGGFGSRFSSGRS